MDLIARIASHFDEHAAAVHDGLELLGAPLAAAIELLTSCLLDNGRILTCGDGNARAAANAFAASLMHGFESERPSLAAIALDAHRGTADDACSRAILALGQPGDVLVAIAPQPGSTEIAAALAAAHERELHCILICSAGEDKLCTALAGQDILLAIPTASTARFSELLTLVLNCLGDGIDCLLLGVEH